MARIRDPKLLPVRSLVLRWLLAVSGMVSIWTASGIPQAAALEKDDVYMSFYILGSFPRNQNVNFGGVDVPNTSVENGIGAGLKVGVFPDITRRLLGFEFEYSALGSGIEFPMSTGSGAESIGSTNLLVFGSMVNLIIRYPGKVIQPYAGIGGGLSHGILFGADIPGRADRDFETSPTFGYQFLAGFQGNMTEKTYVFAEYKRFAANYHWEGLSLDFRAQYALVGIGIRF